MSHNVSILYGFAKFVNNLCLLLFHYLWYFSSADDRDEYHCVLEESAAVQSVCKKLSLKATSASSVSTDDVAAAILSDVQHCQDCQLHDILEELGNQVR